MQPTRSPDLQIDAYLKWVLGAGFQIFARRKSERAVLIVEFREPLTAQQYEDLTSDGVTISKIYVGFRIATVVVPVKDLQGWLDKLQSRGVIYCELGAPTAPAISSAAPPMTGNLSGPQTVIGIIDDGCPFAHNAYRPDGGSNPSVQYLWDQGGKAGTGKVPGDASPFGYGAVYTHQLATALNNAKTPIGIDEDSAYAMIELPSLRGMASHGAQVMSHAAGRAPAIQGRSPPLPLTGPTDIAFVQLAPESLDDPSGLWLDYRGIEGLYAIHNYARGAFNASRIIVNLSYGPQTGAHNGSSLLEQAIHELRKTAVANGYVFRVVLSSGNSHLLRTHAELDLHRLAGAPGYIDWYVSPDSQVDSHLDIWLPQAVTLDHIVVKLESPTGDSIQTDGLMSNDVASITTGTGPLPLSQSHIMLAINPTARASSDHAGMSQPPKLATPGRWRMTILAKQGVSVQGVVHAYLARSDPNMGRPLRGRSGHLESPHYEDPCGAVPSEQLDPDPPKAGAAEVHARGCLNGSATGVDSLAAAGFRLKDRLPAPYSSGGGTRGLRAGPDWAYPTEYSRVLAGLPGRGNRSGVVMRFSGTSIAAPQMVRELAAMAGENFPYPDPKHPAPSPPVPPWFALRFGKGMR